MPTDTITCRSCGHTIMAKGGDFTRWKSLQPRPNDATFWHYCPKKPCQHALGCAIKTAMVAWGYDVPEEPEEVEEVEEVEEPIALLGGRGGGADGRS